MGRRKAKGPRLVTDDSGAGYLDLKPGSGAVTIKPQAAAAAPALSAHSLPQAPVQGNPKAKKADTAGAAWGHMRAPELTPELKRELLIVKMRDALDPKRFYRSADKALPKYFQMGTVVEGSSDSHSRLTKRERKESMLQELLSDGAIRKRAKTQFLKSQAAASSGVKRRSKPMHGQKNRAGNKRR